MIYKVKKIKCDICKKEREVPSRALWAYRTNDSKKWFCSYKCSRKYEQLFQEKAAKNKNKGGFKRPEKALENKDSNEYRLAVEYLNQLKPGSAVSMKDLWEHVFGESMYTYTKMSREHLSLFLRMQTDLIYVYGNREKMTYRRKLAL